VQRLERGGYVRRVPDPRDGRATLVESTPAGTALRERVERLWGQLEADTVGGMPAGEWRELVAGLERVEANLSAATTGGSRR
jgi:DNA-binding MarR family transcriptional regulator